MSKTSVFHVSGFFLLQYKGLRPDINYLCGCIKYKDRILCVQVKSKPCVVYTVMRLIPRKQSHGSETVISFKFYFRTQQCVLKEVSSENQGGSKVVFVDGYGPQLWCWMLFCHFNWLFSHIFLISVSYQYCPIYMRVLE
jgi:hypothetical protein